MEQTNLSTATESDASASLSSNTTSNNQIPRIPPKFDGIQYNTCKNPKCLQYNVAPINKAKRGELGHYIRVSGGVGYYLLKCGVCGEMPPLKSNLGIHEEMLRIGSYLQEVKYCCPNEACENHTVLVGTPKAYRAFGTNARGTKRMQCSKCRKTFVTTGKPTKGQHDTHLNKTIFKMLVNQVALNRIVKMLEISWEVLYNRISFIHRQCLLFVANRERRFKTLPIERLYMAIDRQDYLVNWTERKDKRNVVLMGIAASDNKTGYVFANVLNFDDAVDRNAVETHSKEIGDTALPPPFRKYARVWTELDYIETRQRKLPKSERTVEIGKLINDITKHSQESFLKPDVETFDSKTETEQLPNYGMQIHAEYTMIGMFKHLKELIGNCEQWRFFLDQESGIRAAVLHAFADEIKNRTCEAFYVRIAKDLVQEDKLKIKNDARRVFAETQIKNPHLGAQQIKLLLLKQEIAKKQTIGPYKNEWVHSPFPTMTEPEKAICWLTEHDGFDEDHEAWLYNKASLHSVDCYFMKTRRSLAMCERPLHSSANAGRIWSAYQSYNPSILKKLLEIYRVYSNYCDTPLQGDKKSTPAMRLGLADAVLPVEDILYFAV
jgi:transposase-like protein